jgi:LemA protein
MTGKEGNMRALYGWLVILGVVVISLIYGVTAYNGMVSLKESIPAAWAQVENVLQRRNDLIPNLVNTVKGYAAHEKSIFEDVARARAALSGARTLGEKVEANNQMSGALSRLLAIAENYPNLKADQSFLRLQDELAGTENRIAVERMRYNEMVRAYNTRVQTFPTSLIARMAGFPPPQPYFKAVESAKTVPQVQF